MLNRLMLLGLGMSGLVLVYPAGSARAAVPAAWAGHSSLALLTSDAGDKEKPDKDDDEKDDEHEGKEKKKIEQAVPMEFVPAAVLDAVKKEVPGGTITEAELVAKKGKIVYSFDVKAGDMAYDVKISVTGKFISKEVDDDKDEADEKADKGEKAEKKKPAHEDKD